jgi:hypothetical protein
MMLRSHPWVNSNIWAEIDESLKQERYKVLSDQMNKYICKQLDKGLREITEYHVACGIIIRKMTKNSANINEEWYKNIQECGIQDQISFFFVKQMFSRIIPFVADIIKEKTEHDW